MAKWNVVMKRDSYRCMKKSVQCLSENMNALAFFNSHIHQSPLSMITSVLCLIPPIGNIFSNRFSCSVKALENEIGFLQGVHYNDVNPDQLN